MSRPKKTKRGTKPKKLKHSAIEVRSAKVETRSCKATGLSVRKAANGDMQLVGTAIVFDSPSTDLGGFTEVCRYQAVQKSLMRNSDVYMLWQHDTSQPLSRAKTGTLKLTLTQSGLDFVATLPKSPLGQNAYQAVADGTVDSVSFGFSVAPDGDTWSSDAQGNIVRELLDINLSEISPVTWAAYLAPHVDVRSAPADIRKKLKQDDDLDDDDDDDLDDDIGDNDDDDDDLDEDRCECRCERCIMSDCGNCYNLSCDDEDCDDCAMQQRALQMDLILRRMTS